MNKKDLADDLTLVGNLQFWKNKEIFYEHWSYNISRDGEDNESISRHQDGSRYILFIDEKICFYQEIIKEALTGGRIYNIRTNVGLSVQGSPRKKRKAISRIQFRKELKNLEKWILNNSLI